MKSLKDFSWQVPKVENDCNCFLQKPKKRYFKIIGYLILWFFGVFLILGAFDIYFFYNENKQNILNAKASLVLNLFEIEENIKTKNYKEVDKRLEKIEEKIAEIKNDLQKYENKISFKIFGISFLLKESGKSLDEGFLVLKSSISILQNYEKIFEKNLKKNPLKEVFEELNVIEKNISNLEAKMSFLKKIPLNEDLKLKIEKIEKIIKLGKDSLKDFKKYEGLILEIFGTNSPQTTVFLFQNSNEIRATGGFIGSFLLLNTNNGAIQKFSIYDVYQFDGQITTIEKTPFEAKSLVGKENWSLRDANSNPDLEISSKNIKYLFEKAGGETIDNFVFINQNILGEVIKLIGDIELKNKNLSLNSENYDFLIQYLVESKKNQFISPKLLIINQLINIFKEEISKNPKIIFDLYFLKNNFLKNKDIQFYSSNSKINEKLEDLGIKSIFPKKDFVAPVFISISGNKSDNFIKTNFEIEKKGDFEFNLKIKRKFDIPKNFLKLWNEKLSKKPSDIPKEELKRILGFGGNRAVLQVYVPKDFDLLFVEKGNENLEYKKWTQGNLKVFEIKLSEILDGEILNLSLYFKSEEKISEIEIFKQSGVK